MVSLKHSKLISKIKCPFCYKGLIYHEIDSGHKDGILIHAKQFSKDCDMIFPVINEIIILTDYKFWPIIPFDSYLKRNKKKINDKSYNFTSEIEKQQFEHIKFQQDFFKINVLPVDNCRATSCKRKTAHCHRWIALINACHRFCDGKRERKQLFSRPDSCDQGVWQPGAG